MKFLVVLIPLSGLIGFISCDQSMASPDLSSQALREISPHSDFLTTQPLPSGKSTIENIYYYYPVQPSEEENENDRSDIKPESAGLYKRRRVNRRRGKGNRKNRRKFEETGPKAERRAALRRTAASIQSSVNTVFPYVFVALPLFVFTAILFFFFLNANSGSIEWYARDYKEGFVGVAQGALNEINSWVQTSLSSFQSKYGQNNEDVTNHSITKRTATSVQPLVSWLFPYIFVFVPSGVFAFVIFYYALIATGGYVDYFYKRSFDKRNTDEDEPFFAFQKAVDVYLDKYVDALHSDQCMERSVCHLGIAAAKLPKKDLFFSVMSWIAPKDNSLFADGRMEIMRKASEGEISDCDFYSCDNPITNHLSGAQ